MSCVGAALALALVPGDPDPGCLGVQLDAAGRLGWTTPDPGIPVQLSLPRTRVEGGGRVGVAGARIAVGIARSGGDDGYVGIEGEALVPVVRLAAAEARLPRLGLGLSAGVVEDGWVRTGDAAWGHRALAPTLGEAAGWLDPADLGGAATWTSPGAWVSARAELTTGEGVDLRERNAGKDVGGMVLVRPLAGVADPERLTVGVYGRQGSRGLASVRDHRVGARVSLSTAVAGGGVEALAAWGVDGDATRTPRGLGAWAVVTPWGPLVAAGRLDTWTEAPGVADAGVLVTHAAAGVELPDPGALQLLVGWEHVAMGSAATSIAGADALAAADSVFLQLSTRLTWSAALP